MSTRDRVALALAPVLGLAIGWMDAHNEEVQPAVLAFIVTGAALGALAPRKAALTAIILGAGIPATYFWMHATGRALAYPTQGVTPGFLAVLPALIGTCSGAWATRLLTGKERLGNAE